MYVDQRFSLTDATLAAVLKAVEILDIKPGPGGSRFSDWDLTMRAFESIKFWDTPKVHRGAVVALYPSSQIVAHADAYSAKQRRYHIPLQINSGCWVFHDGDWQQLQLGKVYQMDPTKVHGAVNWGATLRLHLLLDTE
jgi:hypothetical protein